LTILIDIGSTVAKGMSIHPSKGIENIFHNYDTRPIKTQVAEIINALTQEGCDNNVLICSSLNGGLSVGLLCLSKSVSGSVAQHFLEAVGSNIRYMVEWKDSQSAELKSAVDLLIVVGGIDAFPVGNLEHIVNQIELDSFPYERLVFAGHNLLADSFTSHYPNAECVTNLLSNCIHPSNNKLPEFVRDSYLKDIVNKRDIDNLKNLTAVDILPTPLIVSRAFARIQGKMLSPVMIFDVGGATTDMHFLKELLNEDKLSTNLSSYPSIARHVFTAYGVSESKNSTISRLIGDSNCIQLLIEIYGREYHQIYIQLLDGKISEKLIFSACIFLALRDMCSDGNDVPPLLLSRIATIGLTGGAAKCISKKEVRAAFFAATGILISAQVVIDTEYRWWGMGLIDNEQFLMG
jgi:hypothetical protein